MKVYNKTIKVDQELTIEIHFNDKAINDLYIKKGNRKDFNFFKNFQWNQRSLMQKHVD